MSECQLTKGVTVDFERYQRMQAAEAGVKKILPLLEEVMLAGTSGSRGMRNFLSVAKQALDEMRAQSWLTGDDEWSDTSSPEPTEADYRDLQAKHDELLTELFNERQKASALAAQVAYWKDIAEDCAVAPTKTEACKILMMAQELNEDGPSKLDCAEAEIEALRVQVEQLREFALSVNRKCADYIMGGNRINHEDMGAAAFDVYKATSGQCLAEIKAQAGRDGFIAGYDEAWRQLFGTSSPEQSAAFHANEYVKKLRQAAKAGE